MGKYIAATGFFDGVHRGHAAVLDKLKDAGKKLALPVSVVTFWPHPRIVLDKEPEKLGLLSSLDEKEARIKTLGIDKFIVIPFTAAFSQISPKQFIDELVKKHEIAGLCVGYDHHVGKGGLAGFDEIKQICDETGLYCERVNPLITGDFAVSSGKIRNCLSNSLVEEANSMLGYSYFLTGTVVHGKKLGRTIGFPTANIAVNEPLKLIPAEGVYAVKVKIADYSKIMSGMLYIGKKPANGLQTFIEVNIFDFEADIYDKKITVYFEKFVRTNLIFENTCEMKSQLEKDKQTILSIIN